MGLFSFLGGGPDGISGGELGAFPVRGSDDRRRSFGDAISRYNNGPVDLSASNAYRPQQGEALGLMRDAAMGNGPSVAELSLKRNTDRAVQQISGALASQRGMNAGTQMRNIGNTGAAMMNDANSQASLLRAEEMNKARGDFASALLGFRGQEADQALRSQEQSNNMLRYFQDKNFMNDQMDLATALDVLKFNRQLESGSADRGAGVFGSFLESSAQFMGSMMGSMGGGG